jgi:hypothetical protein
MESVQISVRLGSILAPMHSSLPLEFNASSVTPIIFKSLPTINVFANLDTVTLTTMAFALKHVATESSLTLNVMTEIPNQTMVAAPPAPKNQDLSVITAN